MAVVDGCESDHIRFARATQINIVVIHLRERVRVNLPGENHARTRSRACEGDWLVFPYGFGFASTIGYYAFTRSRAC